MRADAREKEFEHIHLVGKPALFTQCRIDRTTIPDGFFCYELRGSDYDTERPTFLEDTVCVNYAGTVLMAQKFLFPKGKMRRRISNELNFIGEQLTVAQFCKIHGILMQPTEEHFRLRPALPEDAPFFFDLTAEEDKKLGCIGHVRIDFGQSGNQFWTTWWPRGPERLNSKEFKTTLTSVVNVLCETGPLKGLQAMEDYCRNHVPNIGCERSYGYVIEVVHYRFYLRCTPMKGDYNAYLCAFDLREQSSPET